ncbi:MAG: murein hydrolase activator EnvC family protein [Acidimicrobiales bacterium]
MTSPPAGPVVALVIAVAVGLGVAEPNPGSDPDTGRAAVSVAAAPTACRPWSAPVDAPVVDPFREPAHRFGPGNRGIEYGVRPGQPVGAAAPGTVSFVGPVAGDLWVVVEHDGGDRSSYGPVLAPAVVRGQTVDSGTELAGAAPGFHFTVRHHDVYVDPAVRFDGACGQPRLVPIEP